MTTTQKKQFNQMLLALKTIANEYQTPAQMRRDIKKQYGLDFEEIIEMAYENIQGYAKNSCKGVKQIA